MVSNPVQDVHAPKAGRPLPKALAVDEAVQLAELHDAEADPWTEARDRAIVELLYGCGLRVGELTGLDVRASNTARGWVDLDAGRPVCSARAASGAPCRWAPRRPRRWRPGSRVRDDCAALRPRSCAIRRAPRRSSSAAPARAFRPGGLAQLRQRSLKAGLAAPVHPHMLRHSFASHVLQSSSDLRAVQELLGHASISTTQVYTHLDFQPLAKAYDAAHPRAKAREEAAVGKIRQEQEQNEILRLRPGKERSLLRRHPWVFESAIAKGGGDAGETVRVESEDGRFLAWAAFSPHSKIRARAWSFDEEQRIDAAFFGGAGGERGARRGAASSCRATACAWSTARPTACRA